MQGWVVAGTGRLFGQTKLGWIMVFQEDRPASSHALSCASLCCRGAGFSTWRGIWVVGEASWGQGSLWSSGICHKVLLLEHSWTQTVGDGVPRLYQGLPALPSLLGCAPHTLDSWAPLAQAGMQSGGSGCRELFEDGAEIFLHPG